MSDRFDPQAKLALHPQFASYMRGEKVYPVGIEISPSGVCQASCDFCFYANTGELGSHRNVFLSDYTLKAVLHEASRGIDSARSVPTLGRPLNAGRIRLAHAQRRQA